MGKWFTAKCTKKPEKRTYKTKTRTLTKRLCSLVETVLVIFEKLQVYSNFPEVKSSTLSGLIRL